MKNKELRTLKDLIIKANTTPDEDDEHIRDVVSVGILRAQAIKWVKEDNEICPDCKFLRELGNSYPFCWRCHKWMKRLNITEDDLKNEK